jgi:hypothetical protein
VAGSKLNKVLIDGGSGLNVLFTKTLKKMKLDITPMLTKSSTPFYGIVPGNAAIPLGYPIWTATTPASSATDSGEHSRTLQSRDTLTTRKARKRLTKATVTSRNPTNGERPLRRTTQQMGSKGRSTGSLEH